MGELIISMLQRLITVYECLIQHYMRRVLSRYQRPDSPTPPNGSSETAETEFSGITNFQPTHLTTAGMCRWKQCLHSWYGPRLLQRRIGTCQTRGDAASEYLLYCFTLSSFENAYMNKAWGLFEGWHGKIEKNLEPFSSPCIHKFNCLRDIVNWNHRKDGTKNFPC